MNNGNNNILKYEDYLNQKKLGLLLDTHYGIDRVQKEVRVPNTRYKWDFVIDNNVVVEFDGFRHYTDTIQIRNDNIKDKIAKEEYGYKVIRIPYFIQMTDWTFSFYFKDNVIIDQNYKHGFVDAKVFPATFCYLGMKRYKDEVKQMSDIIQNEIEMTLKEKAKKYGREYVYIDDKVWTIL